MKTIILSRKWEFTGQTALFWVLIPVTSILLATPEYVYYGVAALFTTVLLPPTHQGITFDQNNQRYKLYRSVAGIKFGAWQQAPNFARVVVKYHTHVHRSDSKYTWAGTSNHTEEYVLLLSISNARNGIVLRKYALSGLEEARLTAATLATILKLETDIVLRDAADNNQLTISS